MKDQLKFTLISGGLLMLGLTLVLLLSFAPASTAGGTNIYMPLVQNAATVDLTVDSLEINQTVQTASNSVPLVTNRNTIVRVYAEAPADGPVNGVVVRLSGYRNGNLLGHLDSAPRTIPVDATRADANSSANFLLPNNWLSGNVSLTAMVDPDDTVTEPDENNNSANETANFINVPALEVMVVPIDYQHEGSNDPGFYPAQRVDNISDWIERIYPIHDVNVNFRSQDYFFQGNLENAEDWVEVDGNGFVIGGLLYETLVIKDVEDPGGVNSPNVYYAFVPTQNGANDWFSSGIAGIGFIGLRVSVGLNLGQNDSTGSLAGHEIGHNLDRRHAPCGNPGGVDVNYPYPGASIGEYGIDIPNGLYFGPADAVDFMSYCEPSHVSDYTAVGLINDQLANGLAPAQAPVKSLHVIAGIATDGTLVLAPTYAYSGIPTPAAPSAYEVQLLDSAGNLLTAHPLQLLEAGEEGVSASLLSAVVDLPETPVATLRLLHNGETQVERALTTAEAAASPDSLTLNRSADTIILNWAQADTPAIVRYTPDGGDSWFALGVDILGGTFTLDGTLLPAGSNGRFEVILANAGAPAILEVTQTQ